MLRSQTASAPPGDPARQRREPRQSAAGASPAAPALAGAAHPTIRLKPGGERRLLQGHPWAYSNEVQMTPEAKAVPPGSPVVLETANGMPLGVALFNPHPLVSARLLARDPATGIDADFIAARLSAALALRERLVDEPYYRLVHAEADGLPGLVIDRFADLAVVQANTAGMERLTPAVLEALDRVLAPKSVLLRNDSAARLLEGLDQGVTVAKGKAPGRIAVVEHGTTFRAEPETGQKTGWFFDQRENRALVAGFARGRSVLDAFAHAGGFGLQAARAGARFVSMIDRSAAALALAEAAAQELGVAERCAFHKSDVFAALEHLARQGERFDIVVADPPAYVKSKKDLQQGLKGYRKLARLAAGLVAPGGLLFIASCSHAVDAPSFQHQVARGLADAAAESGRGARILAATGAAPDHPVHPLLPESAYLKGLLLALD
ncbi:MAG: class I SAM-dependent rRNA methyltransferase [Alphaproteobacteria bacterium]|nr:class I SAM-dependent rRNA methyltransferase [Alphaproteobacteria bacterium]